MKTLVIGPHPDDELLGCGGTLIKKRDSKNILGWILVTNISEDKNWNSYKVKERQSEIETVRKELGIKDQNFFSLGYPTCTLDSVSLSNLIKKISEAINLFQPEEIFLPHPGDAHSDHKVTFEASIVCTKWFRYPFIRRILTYNTISETELGINPVNRKFEPNFFVNISEQIEEKISLINTYKSEIKKHPFPRSNEAIIAQAKLFGSYMGVDSAEAFQLIREFES